MDLVKYYEINYYEIKLKFRKYIKYKIREIINERTKF